MSINSQLINNTDDTRSPTKDTLWSTTETPFTTEEEDAIVTLVVVVVGVIAAIVILFSMGIFIDCKHQKKDSLKKRKLRLKMPPLARRKKSQRDDAKSLASDMCPNGTTDNDFRTRDVIV